jgi:hypothetical protein
VTLNSEFVSSLRRLQTFSVKVIIVKELTTTDEIFFTLMQKGLVPYVSWQDNITFMHPKYRPGTLAAGLTILKNKISCGSHFSQEVSFRDVTYQFGQLF